MSAQPIKMTFEGASGALLSARLDLPAGPAKAFALFAHCFTCSKDIIAARTISTALTSHGIGVLRFDFTGLGGSGGDFGSTNFSMNIADLKRAADVMRQSYTAPSLLIGHSLGGAAVLAAAADIPEVKAVATIGAPSNVSHVTGSFAHKLSEIDKKGEAIVSLGHRPFRIEKQFIDDLKSHDFKTTVGRLNAALLVMHAPTDDIVSIDHASALFLAAKRARSFVSLDGAAHLLSNKKDGAYAAQVIAAWAGRYIETDSGMNTPAQHEEDVVVSETAQGTFQNLVQTGPHQFLADEPTDMGGLGSGPSPYDLLCAALGACTTMTIRMYVDRKGLPVDHISCSVRHDKTHLSDMDRAADGNLLRPDRFTRTIKIEGDLQKSVRDRIFEIAGRCPVHKTLETGATVITERDLT